ncbi:MAG: hypothetical protein ABSG42_09160 [Nitrospirota bacterium]
MEKRPTRRFICEHQVFPNLAPDKIRNMHTAKKPGLTVLYSFSNIDEKCMYSVLESPDRLTIESFFNDLRIPCDSIMEIEYFAEGFNMRDMRAMKEAA